MPEALHTPLTPVPAPRVRTVMIDGREAEADKGGDWRGVLAAYLVQKDVGSKESSRTYRKELQLFFRWVETTGRQLSGLTSVDIIEYKAYLEDERFLTSQTVAGYVCAIRGFYAWAEAEKLYPNIARGIRARHDADHVRMHLTREETRSLLDYFRGRSARDYAIVNLMLRCGLRTVEVSRTRVCDVAIVEGRRILYIQGKGRKDRKRWVVLRDGAWLPIKEYLDGRSGLTVSSPLFASESRRTRGKALSARSVQRICKDALRAIGLDSHQYSAHSLRHTAGVRIINNGGTVADVQEVLGHASIDTSRIYLKSASTELRLANPAERFLDDIY